MKRNMNKMFVVLMNYHNAKNNAISTDKKKDLKLGDDFGIFHIEQ